MLKAIIFDLDGVLIDSEPLMRQAFEVSYRNVIGTDPPPIEAYLEHMGESFPSIMDQLQLPHSLWEPYREYCQQHIEQINLFPMSRELLEWALAHKLKLAILTGKDRERTLKILEYFRLNHFFEAVITSDQLRHSKPDPEGMLRALHLLDCPFNEAVMVGDAVSDIQCAQAVGVTAIAVTWGTKPELIQTLSRPNYIVHDWESLFQILYNLHFEESGVADDEL